MQQRTGTLSRKYEQRLEQQQNVQGDADKIRVECSIISDIRDWRIQALSLEFEKLEGTDAEMDELDEIDDLTDIQIFRADYSYWEDVFGDF